MSWLKGAEGESEDLLSRMLAALKGADQVITKSLSFLPADEEAVFAGEWLGEIREVITDAETELGKKEGSVYNDTDYQRDDLNKGLSGLFEEEHVLDHTPDQSNDPGPASTTPGAKTPVAPGIFEY